MSVGGDYSAQHCLTSMICICKRLTYCAGRRRGSQRLRMLGKQARTLTTARGRAGSVNRPISVMVLLYVPGRLPWEDYQGIRSRKQRRGESYGAVWGDRTVHLFGIVKPAKYYLLLARLFTKYFVSQSLVEITDDSFSTFQFSFIHSKFTHFCLLSVTMNYVKLKCVSEINAVCRRVWILFGIADQIW